MANAEKAKKSWEDKLEEQMKKELNRKTLEELGYNTPFKRFKLTLTQFFANLLEKVFNKLKEAFKGIGAEKMLEPMEKAVNETKEIAEDANYLATCNVKEMEHMQSIMADSIAMMAEVTKAALNGDQKIDPQTVAVMTDKMKKISETMKEHQIAFRKLTQALEERIAEDPEGKWSEARLPDGRMALVAMGHINDPEFSGDKIIVVGDDGGFYPYSDISAIENPLYLNEDGQTFVTVPGSDNVPLQTPYSWKDLGQVTQLEGKTAEELRDEIDRIVNDLKQSALDKNELLTPEAIKEAQKENADQIIHKLAKQLGYKDPTELRRAMTISDMQTKSFGVNGNKIKPLEKGASCIISNEKLKSAIRVGLDKDGKVESISYFPDKTKLGKMLDISYTKYTKDGDKVVEQLDRLPNAYDRNAYKELCASLPDSNKKDVMDFLRENMLAEKKFPHMNETPVKNAEVKAMEKVFKKESEKQEEQEEQKEPMKFESHGNIVEIDIPPKYLGLQGLGDEHPRLAFMTDHNGNLNIFRSDAVENFNSDHPELFKKDIADHMLFQNGEYVGDDLLVESWFKDNQELISQLQDAVKEAREKEINKDLTEVEKE